MVPSGGVRARVSEGLRLRCTDPACPFRPSPELSSDVHLQEEIPEDDLEAPECDANMEPDGGESDDMDIQPEGAGSETVTVGKRGTAVNMFPFAYPVAFHLRVL
jgi:hypothetical protein